MHLNSSMQSLDIQGTDIYGNDIASNGSQGNGRLGPDANTNGTNGNGMHSHDIKANSTQVNAIQQQINSGAIASYVNNTCPPGTTFHLLEVGWLECDEAFLTRGSNTSKMSTKDTPFVNKRRELPMYCVLIDHPHEGLILWETGCGKEYPTVWGPELSDVFARVKYEPQHELRAAVAATGHTLEDVKTIILGHLHLDHAGGLDEFMDRTDVEIWVHDRELKSALWSVATGADVGCYLEHYLKLSLNWKTFDDTSMDFCQGITLHHLPGHTDGLMGMQINMLNSGTWFFISDHAHVIENWRDGHPHGWLARDHPAWCRSTSRLKQLQRITKGRIIPGHDKETFLQMQKEGPAFT